MNQIIDAEYRITFDATTETDINGVIPDKVQLVYNHDAPEVTEIRILGNRRLKSGKAGSRTETSLVDHPDGYEFASDWDGCSRDIPEWIRPLIPEHRPSWAATAVAQAEHEQRLADGFVEIRKDTDECGICHPDGDYSCRICFPGGVAPEYLDEDPEPSAEQDPDVANLAHRFIGAAIDRLAPTQLSCNGIGSNLVDCFREVHETPDYGQLTEHGTSLIAVTAALAARAVAELAKERGESPQETWWHLSATTKAEAEEQDVTQTAVRAHQALRAVPSEPAPFADPWITGH